MLIITTTEGGLQISDPDSDAKTGRWCAAPLIPDRCDRCFDPETLAHYPAEGYREEKATDGTVWRFGICHRCQKDKRCIVRKSERT
jgi:hypothetical protein